MITTFVIANLLTQFKPPPPRTVHEAGVRIVKIAPAPAPIQPLEAKVQPEVVVDTPPPVETPQVAPEQPTGGCVAGYSTGQYALDQIIAHESGGNSCATNPGGCFGLLQACPGAPLRSACGGSPDCQIAWFKSNKTGGRSWEQIWAEWQVKGWW